MKKLRKDYSMKKMNKALNSTRKHGLASSSRKKAEVVEDQTTTYVDVNYISSSSGKKRKEREEQSMSDVDVGKMKKKSSVNRNSKKASAKKMKRLPKSKERLRIRTQPCHLYNLIKDLTEEQIKVVSQMGFASIQHFNVVHIPSCCNRIKSSGDNGRMFQLNFMVVYNTVMCQITKMNIVNIQFLPSLLPGAERGKTICTTLPALQHYDTDCITELEADLIVDDESGFLRYLQSRKENNMGNNDVDLVVTMEGVEHQAVDERENVKENDVDEVDLFDDDINNEAFEQDVGIRLPKVTEPNILVSPVSKQSQNMDVENSIQEKVREIVKLSKDVENLIKEGIEQHRNDEEFKTLVAEWEAKHNNKPAMQTGETSDKVEHTTEINDNNIKVGFDLSQYDITCSMMEELEPCLNGSVKSSLLMLTQFSEAKTDTDKGKNTSSYKEISDDKNDVNKGDKSRKDYDVTEKGCQTVKPDVHRDGTT
ncbi:hypothetical protein L1987_08956 [Smallanthus sonchifolius]|uniref:Uncharacterized protein n=1 Tax=Smallanthus sonchifolius TaxID=185202 RepID=A0ACB9JMK9_9ASTR|nr:hypothetical protein L1987_08956 [Smallanthus sonchifolius]